MKPGTALVWAVARVEHSASRAAHKEGRWRSFIRMLRRLRLEVDDGGFGEKIRD
jgi:hypothetical protein